VSFTVAPPRPSPDLPSSLRSLLSPALQEQALKVLQKDSCWPSMISRLMVGCLSASVRLSTQAVAVARAGMGSRLECFRGSVVARVCSS
jgi:hypothetical protein